MGGWGIVAWAGLWDDSTALTQAPLLPRHVTMPCVTLASQTFGVWQGGGGGEPILRARSPSPRPCPAHANCPLRWAPLSFVVAAQTLHPPASRFPAYPAQASSDSQSPLGPCPPQAGRQASRPRPRALPAPPRRQCPAAAPRAARTAQHMRNARPPPLRSPSTDTADAWAHFRARMPTAASTHARTRDRRDFRADRGLLLLLLLWVLALAGQAQLRRAAAAVAIVQDGDARTLRLAGPPSSSSSSSSTAGGGGEGQRKGKG